MSKRCILLPLATNDVENSDPRTTDEIRQINESRAEMAIVLALLSRSDHFAQPQTATAVQEILSRCHVTRCKSMSNHVNRGKFRWTSNGGKL